jgi:hypothetical protein
LADDFAFEDRAEAADDFAGRFFGAAAAEATAATRQTARALLKNLRNNKYLFYNGG